MHPRSQGISIGLGSGIFHAQPIVIGLTKLPLVHSEHQLGCICWLAVAYLASSRGCGGPKSTKAFSFFCAVHGLIYSPERVHGTYWRRVQSIKRRYYGYRATAHNFESASSVTQFKSSELITRNTLVHTSI